MWPGMKHLSIHTRDSWPDDTAFLLKELPRDGWPDHPGFVRSTQNWLGAHQGFRRLSNHVTGALEDYLDRARDPGQAAAELGWAGDILVRNLHGHHTWEDRSFFPEIRAVDPRFEAGLETLEADHGTLDETLDTLTRQANRVIKLIQLDETQARSEAGGLHDTASRLERFLERHLTDEEDLIVPIVLTHRMRG